MNTLTLFAVVAAFSVGVFGDGHGDHSSDDVPRLNVHVHLKNDVFTFHASIDQKFPDHGEPSEAISVVTLMKADSVQNALMNVTAYMVWSDISNCSMFDPETAEYIHEFTSDIKMDNSSGPSPNMSMAAMEAQPEESDEPLIFPVMYSTIVLQVNGVNYCMQPEVKEMKMKKIRLLFPQCSDFNPQALRETIHERFDIDMKRVFVGRFGHDEDCHFADVYFQHTFEDGSMIKKIWESLSSKSGLGRFSGSDKCMTNVRDSFFTDVALGMCSSYMMEQQQSEPKELPTCVGVSSQLAQQYRERIRKYDCLVAEYSKKYGIKAEGCMKRQQNMQGSDKQACTCASNAEAELQNQLRILLTYVGAPLYFEELYVKKHELSKMMTGQSFDQHKLDKLVEEIKNLEIQQAEYYFKSFFGFCIVSGHGVGAIEKLDWVRERVPTSIDGDDILMDLMKEAINYYLDLRTSSSKFMDQDMSVKRETLKLKGKMLLGVSNMCSTMEERERVWHKLMDLAKSFREHVESFNEMIDNEMIANATRAIADMVEENPEEIARKVFLVLFSPMEIPEEDEAAKKVMDFFETMDDNKVHIAEKIRSWLKDADVMDILSLQIILMTPEDTRKECDLSGLAAQVQPPAEDMSVEEESRESNYDTDYHQDEYSMPRRRGYTGRRRAPPRRPMYEDGGYYARHRGYDY